MLIHTSSAVFGDLADAIAYADAYVADTLTADYTGIPVTGYDITAENGIYGITYRVTFCAPYAIVAGTRFAA